ncbi:Ferredoxin--NADP reductase [Candidatus Magnetaquicoccaceae bacterium FCR-1]|uniref:Ferredoxin--NADP reductase n=1 Tax=Candidatus Magnetaquiglobus chichijimensis TaxID=3141448 RepID=A0ABQ0C9N3_9PROT
MRGEHVSPQKTDSSQGSSQGGVIHYSDDPRDAGWVKQNIPCQSACPAGTNVPAYIRAIAEGKHGLAYEINREANVLPGVLGRICSRPCESACRHGWSGNGDPVGICNLKRSAADMKDVGHRITERLYAPTGKRVAVVGAGPAGIAAAHDLALLGHDVTILEREERPGGMLRYGIPEFRLPRTMLDIELHNALRVGVQLKSGVTVGSGKGATRVSTLLADFDAVLLATGCMAPVLLPLRGIPDGEDLSRHCQDVEYGLDFLMELHRGQNKRVGRRVAVVGAGFTALDCARVAKRLGGQEVTIHLRTSEEYIPVTSEELFETKREGIRIKGLRTPVALRTDENGRLIGVEFIQNRLGGWRENGRRLATPIEGSEFVENCDTLIIAIGQKTVNDFLDMRVELDRWGNVRVAENGMTSVQGLFAAGDYVRGASTAIEAIGHARQIADRLDTWLVGRKRRRVVSMEPVPAPLREPAHDFIPRQHMPTIPLPERQQLVREVECGYTQDLALEEAKRCYLCDLRYEINVDRCIYCRACIEVAPRNCIKLVRDVEIRPDGTHGALQETREWQRVAAIWIDNNECIRCGACFKVCPVSCISITRNHFVTVDG